MSNFQAPKKHLGWANRTLTARDYKPICPQLTNYMFDETHNGYTPHAIKTDEDCLFLNVWTPQVHIHSYFNSGFFKKYQHKSNSKLSSIPIKFRIN